MLVGLTVFANEVFGLDLLAESSYSLGNIVEDELAATTPLCLCSISGYDASYRVDQVVEATGARCAAVAMGSREGFALADQAIANGARTGTWVLLKNVHLSAAWLGQLEKKLQTLNPHRSFRLFLTMETNPTIPVSILRQACVVMNEPPPGIKANLLETLNGIPPARFAAGPAEKARLYFLLAW